MRKGLITLAATAGLVGVLYTFSPLSGGETAEELRFIYPEVSPVLDTVTLHGTVIAAEKQLLYAQGSSRVLEIYVSEGQMVTEGQCLMKLEQTETAYGEQAAVAAVLSDLQEAVYSGNLSEAEEIISAINTNNTLQIKGGKAYYLYSEKSSVVMKINADEGETAGMLFPCMELFCPNSLQMTAAAGEDVVGLLRADMECAVSVPAFDISELAGKVTSIAPYARQTAQLTGQTSYETDVTICMNEHESLRPGYRATAKVVVSSRDNALLIPYEAVGQDDSGREYVMKLQGRRLVKQAVTTGSELENKVEIREGLSVTDTVMLEPDPQWEGVLVSLVSH